jgi:hypothetical protein
MCIHSSHVSKATALFQLFVNVKWYAMLRGD